MALVNPWKFPCKRMEILKILYFYHASGKSIEISKFKTGTNLLKIFYFHHATDKSMEISMYKAGPKLFVFL